MATIQPKRLRRVLNRAGVTGSMFSAASTTLGTLTDDEIHQIVIHRGKSDRGGGVHPSTLELETTGLRATPVHGENCKVQITAQSSSELASHLGAPIAAADIAQRFNGRLAETHVEDTGKRFTTTFTASSWSSQYVYYRRKLAPVAGHTIDWYLNDILANNYWNVPEFVGEFEYIAKTEDPLTAAEAIDKYAASIGYLFQERRDGTSRVLTLAHREAHAMVRLAEDLPITRSQAISPAQWSRTSMQPSKWLWVSIINENGNLAEYRVERADYPGFREQEDVDWSHIQVRETGFSGSQPWREAHAEVNSTSPTLFQVPSVTIDLLALIDSPKSYQRQQAAYLLRLQQGEPVFFSGDWPAWLRGVHFAEGINETITPESWEIELSLVPWQTVTGNVIGPQVPARVWRSAISSWGEETKRWNEA